MTLQLACGCWHLRVVRLLFGYFRPTRRHYSFRFAAAVILKKIDFGREVPTSEGRISKLVRPCTPETDCLTLICIP